MAFGDGWVFEVAIEIALELKTLHEFAGPKINCGGKRDDFAEVKVLKAVVERLEGSAIGEAAAPEFCAESPADFGARHEWSSKGRNVKPAESRESPINFNGPEAPAPLFNGAPQTFEGGNAFVSGQQSREIAHHDRIGIHRNERLEVLVFPLAQEHVFHSGRR